MLNANLLKAEIARNGMSQRDVAKSIGMSANTFSKKIKNGTFGITEADQMIKLLGIQNPSAIFLIKSNFRGYYYGI